MSDKKLPPEYYDTSSPSTPYGGGNPYYFCNACERSMIEVSYAGHYEDCSWVKSKLFPEGGIFNRKELRKFADLVFDKTSACDFEHQDEDYQEFMNGLLEKIQTEIKNLK